MDLVIRRIERGDLPAVLALIREFAEFEHLEAYCEVTEDNLARAMFGADSVVEGLIAADGEKTIGYAIFYPNFASFRGKRGFYLEDIYVTTSARGQGVGERMLRSLAELAADRGYERIDFMVLEWNTSAISFYKKLGAHVDNDERHFKFTDQAFSDLARPDT
ncbi:MAG: N-acetyltransferase family protein [Pyrinomonadaceae bacterium]